MVVVIGGGGAGLYFSTAYKLKNPEEKVIVIEEHESIGKPVQCTGILTREILKLIPENEVNKFKINEIADAEIHSPNNMFTTPIDSDIIIDNVAFVEHLAQKAQKAGVEIKTGHKYLGNEGNSIKIRNIKTKEIFETKTNNLIGADGPSSIVAKNNGLYKKRSFLTGVQARVKIKDLNPNKIIFYPYIGEYAWLAPEGEEYARIGVAAKSNAKLLFDDFIKKFPGKIEEMQGGPIPLHKPGTRVQQTVKKNRVSEREFTVSLLGDAALQIKNTTGGGIIPGMNAANALSKGFNTYKTELKPLNRELLVHYYMNKALNNYSDKDWDRLINKVNNPKIKMILLKTNRDEAKKLLFKLLAKPKMLIEGLRAGIKTL